MTGPPACHPQSGTRSKGRVAPAPSSATTIASSRPGHPPGPSSPAAAAAVVLAGAQRAAYTNYAAHREQRRQQRSRAHGQGVGGQAAQVGGGAVGFHACSAWPLRVRVVGMACHAPPRRMGGMAALNCLLVLQASLMPTASCSCSAVPQVHSADGAADQAKPQECQGDGCGCAARGGAGAQGDQPEARRGGVTSCVLVG